MKIVRSVKITRSAGVVICEHVESTMYSMSKRYRAAGVAYVYLT